MKLIKYFIILSLVFISNAISNEFPLDPTIKYGKLENGLTYYIKKNKTPKNKVYLKLIVKAGSLMEEDHQQGLAHLIEHMAFNGSKNFPKNEIDNYLSSIGVNLGSHFNATAGYFATNYFFEIPLDKEENLEKGIQILSDIAGNLDLKGDQFEKERKIVEEEWRKDAGEDNTFLKKFFKFLHKDSLLLKRRPIGKIEIIQNFKYQDAIDFYEKWYQPQIMAVYAIGDIEEKQVENLIKKNFNYLKNKSKLKIPDPSIPDFKDNQFFTYQSENEERITFTIWEKNKFNPINTFENYRLIKIKDLVEYIFQRRIEKLVNENKVNFNYGYIGSFDTSILDEYSYIAADLKSDKINEGIKDILYLIEQVKKYGFLQKELDQTKKLILENLKKNIVENKTRSSESFVNEYSRHFTKDEMISGPENEYKFSVEILPTISLEDINQYFNNYIKSENQIIEFRGPSNIINLPKREELSNLENEVKLSSIDPYVYEIKKVDLIKEELKGSKIVSSKYFPSTKIKKITLENGAVIFLKKTDFQSDQIQIRGYSLGGYSTASDEMLASAENTEGILLNANIGELNLSEIEDLYPGILIDVYPEINELSDEIYGYSNNKYLEDLFKLLYLNFTDLRIKQYHVDNYKEQQIDEYKTSSQNPKAEYYKEFSNKFNQNHPRNIYPDLSYYNQINLEDVQKFYASRYQNGGEFVFVIVGDFKINEVEAFASKYIGSLNFDNKKDNFIDHKTRVNQKRVEVSYKEEDPIKASVLRFYNKRFNNNLTQRYKAKLLMAIVDKIFFNEIREKDKLVYSIFMGEYFSQKLPNGLISIVLGYDSDPKNVEVINKKIENILNGVKNKSFDKQVFINQKKALINELKKEQNTNKYWIDSLIRADKYKENFERYAYIEQIINQISLNDISLLAKKYFDQEYFNSIQLIKE